MALQAVFREYSSCLFYYAYNTLYLETNKLIKFSKKCSKNESEGVVDRLGGSDSEVPRSIATCIIFIRDR